MTPRDTLRDSTSTDPGDVPETDEKLEKLDGPLPKYVVERKQSDMADAARHHAEPMTPPAPAGVRVVTGRVEIVHTPVPSKKDTDPGLGPMSEEEVERAIKRARSGPIEDDIEPHERAALNQLRMQTPRALLEGVETDPSAHKQDERRRNVLIVLAAAVVVATVLILIAYSKTTPRPTPSATSSTIAPPTQTQTTPPVPTPTPTPTQTQAPTVTATTTTTHTAPIPTIKPTKTTTATSTATQTAPTNTNTFNPLIEHDF